MNEEFLAGLTFKRLVQILYRQRNTAAIFVFSVLSLAVLALILIPKKYESEGKLFVQIGRGGVTLDPTATTGQTITIQETRESEINSIVDVLTSQGLLQSVVEHEDLGAEKILESKFFLSKVKLPSVPLFSKSDEEYDRQKKTELAINKLRNAMHSESPRKAATISIWYTSESPELSKQLVDLTMETYIKHHVEARRTEGSFDFFESQMHQQKDEVANASDALSQFKNEIGVMSITARRKAVREKISKLEQELILADSRRAGAQSQMAEAKDIVDATPEQMEIEATEGLAHHASDLMRDRLYDLELSEKELSAKYTDDHPLVVEVKKQVAEARDIANAQTEDRVVVKKGVNPNREKLLLRAMNAQVDLTSTMAQTKVLKEQLKTANEEMEFLNKNEIKLAQLTRRSELAEQNLRTYSVKLEEARINNELDIKKISNVKIVQPGTLQVKHVRPKKSLLLLGSLMFSIFGAACFALLVDHWTNRIYSASDIVGSSSVKVLGCVPRLEYNEELNIRPAQPTPRLN